MQVHLPHDIISEILLRLSAEFLITLKAVCKLWFDIITDEVFVDTHHSLHQRDSNYVVLYNGATPNCEGDYEFMNLEDMENSKYQLHLHQLEDLLKDRICLIYTCDGLLLFQSSRDRNNQFYVCNPITRKCSVLPPHTTEGFEDYVFALPLLYIKRFVGSMSWGMVRDASEEKFMVVGLNAYQKPNRCFVFTTDTNWREFKISELHNYSNLPTPNLVNRELYWYARIRMNQARVQPHLRSSIYWLDLTEEKLKETQVPFQEGKKNSIIELKGFLCLTDNPFDKNELDIWTLKDREKGIWNKDYSINLPSQSNDGFGYWYRMGCIYYSNQITIVLPDENMVLIYDFKNKDWKKFAFPSKHGGDISFKHVHVNSLVKFK